MNIHYVQSHSGVVNIHCLQSRSNAVNIHYLYSQSFSVFSVLFRTYNIKIYFTLWHNVSVQAACRWLLKLSPSVGCHYFPPDLRSPSQPKNVTVLRPVPSYTAWWQSHIGVNNLPRVVTQLCPSVNWTHDLLITSATPYRYATVPPIWLIWSKRYITTYFWEFIYMHVSRCVL